MDNKISTGIWLVFLGLIILLYNLDIIPFSFYAILKFWPLVLVSVGVSLLFQGKPNGTLITAIVNVLICIFLLVIGMTSHSDGRNGTENYPVHMGAYQEKAGITYQHTKTASIDINGGATKYIIKKPADTSKLFEAATANSNVHFELNEKNSAKNRLELNTNIRANDSSREPIALFFNSQPQWDITFNVGAVTVDGDFSDHHMQNFTINSGASSFKLKFGKPTNGTSKIEINTAASSIKLLLPKDVEYAIKSENVISSTKIDGKKQKGRNSTYKTDKYDQANDKYYIEISGAANSFSLDTY